MFTSGGAASRVAPKISGSFVMAEFVNVPVPADMVEDVMRLIVGRGEDTPSAPDTTADVTGDSSSRVWSREEFERLHAATAPSVVLFGRMLSVLADEFPRAMTVAEIGDRVGVEGLTMQRRFGPASRWMRNRLGHVQWPVEFRDGDWAMINEGNARLWQEIAG